MSNFLVVGFDCVSIRFLKATLLSIYLIIFYKVSIKNQWLC